MHQRRSREGEGLAHVIRSAPLFHRQGSRALSDGSHAQAPRESDSTLPLAPGHVLIGCTLVKEPPCPTYSDGVRIGSGANQRIYLPDTGLARRPQSARCRTKCQADIAPKVFPLYRHKGFTLDSHIDMCIWELPKK